ncbi:MAG: hypothetical protein HYZ84_04360 [Candidatus Omnitrophica bacterium]|nr:hypothetical protein [Candidatus Omnitrophota bacterium]
MLTVGIPKEIKSKEKRVGLTPSFAAELTRQGIQVLVEKGAGGGSGFSDADYEKAGAKIRPDHSSLFASADLIQKVKEPLAPEFSLLRKGQIIFCFLHLASPVNCDLLKALIHSGTTAIAFETLVVDGKVPILKPMSEIAGSLASIYAAYFCSLSSPNVLVGDLDSRQILAGMTTSNLESLAGRYPDFPEQFRLPKTVIFGGGVAGTKAAEFALKMEAEVILVEKNEKRREQLSSPNFLIGDQTLGSRQKHAGMTALCVSPTELTEPMLQDSGVLIASVHNPGKRADPVLNAETLARISRTTKKVMIDISIDQGGNFPEARPTSYEDPLYLDSSGNLRFAVANIPSLCGRGASEALAQSAFHYTAALAKEGREVFKKIPELQAAVNVDQGKVLIPSIQEAHQLR